MIYLLFQISEVSNNFNDLKNKLRTIKNLLKHYALQKIAIIITRFVKLMKEFNKAEQKLLSFITYGPYI